MLNKIWQWIKGFFQRWFGTGGKTTTKLSSQGSVTAPPPALTDTDYEFLFTQLLDGVAQGWERSRVLKFFHALGDRGKPELWTEWLQRFGSRVLASSAPNNELGARMVQLGEMQIGAVGDLALDLGMQILTKLSSGSGAIWEYAGPDLYGASLNGEVVPESENSAKHVTIDELRVMLNQDSDLVEQLAGQMGVEPNPEAIIQVLVNQFNGGSATAVTGAEAFFNQANQQLQQGDFSEAIASYEQVIAIEPDNPVALHNQGVAYARLEQWETALNLIERALAIAPDVYDPHYNRACILHALERFPEAIAAYDTAIAIKDDIFDPWEYRGDALRVLGRYEEALTSYDRALSLTKDNTLIARIAGHRHEVLIHLGREADAIADFDRVSTINSDA